MQHKKLKNHIALERTEFELFKSQICHMVKEKGDIDFIIDSLRENWVKKYWDLQWYAEAFYVLAMIDYLSKLNELPLAKEYDDIRKYSLKEYVYPRDIIVLAMLKKDNNIYKQAINEAIPEFLKYHIVEKGIRDVC